MFDLFCLWFGAALRIFRNPQDLLLENLTLRHQLTTFKRRHPKPRLGVLDKLFWVAARQFWSQWKQSLLLVSPATSSCPVWLFCSLRFPAGGPAPQKTLTLRSLGFRVLQNHRGAMA